MASILKVDEMQGVTNTNEMTIAANNVTITGEGTATMRLQQGVAKSWAHVSQSSTQTLDDSLNVASITDEGTGDASYTLTNAMSDSNFSVTALTGYKANSSVEIAHLRELTASKVRIRNTNSSSYRDPETYCSTVQGDLA